MGEKDKVKTIIEINRKVWGEIKKESFIRRESVSQVVERKLREAYNIKEE